MICYFPEIYEDEIMYSWFARYYSHSGYPCYVNALEDLMMNCKNRIDPEFTGTLNQEARKVIDSLYSINDFLREDNVIAIDDMPFQSLMIEELLGNIKIEKRDLISDLINSDAGELKKCFEVGAYKACLIICGSILETVLLDWLSELEDTNYFLDEQNMHINLVSVIQRLKTIYNPDWNSEANAAHDIRLKRNLVHPSKYIRTHPAINRDTCLQVLNEMKSVLESRGIENSLDDFQK